MSDYECLDCGWGCGGFAAAPEKCPECGGTNIEPMTTVEQGQEAEIERLRAENDELRSQLKSIAHQAMDGAKQGYQQVIDDKNEIIEVLRARVAELEAANRWIPVSERLPENMRMIWTFGAYDSPAVCWYRNGRFVNCYDTTLDMSGVTHWKLPEAPVEIRGT